MPLLSAEEIRAMSKDERRNKLRELKVELMKIRTSIKAGGKVENPARVRELKRAIARLLTVENEERLEVSGGA